MSAIRAATSHLILITLLILFSSTLNETSAMDCNKNDLKALLQIKETFENPPELSAWLPNTNCCSWDSQLLTGAIICDETGRVYLLQLDNFTIKTNVPSAFGDLTALETLTLTNMGLTGPIPSSFRKLSKLSILEISYTSLSGSIPDFLTRTNLSALRLTNNKLSGQIPSSLSKLPFLRVVDFSYNQLSGSIPPGLLHWEYQFLYLSNNQLSGEIPKSYGQGDINTLDFSHNKLTGDPSFLFSIDKKTDKIDLSWNQFEFDMTKTMFPWKLTYLDLSHNRIRGAVSKSLKDLYQLRYLNLSYNELCGEIPTGRAMVYQQHGADCYLHNKCLCGTPLPACAH